MHWQSTPLFFPLILSATVCTLLAAYAWRHRTVPAARGFVLLMASSAWWSLFYALYRASARLQEKQLFAEAVQAGAIVVPVAWTLFCLQYTGRERWLTTWRSALLWAVPLLTLGMVLTNGWHHQFWSEFDLVVRDGAVAVHTGNAWGFWLHVAYSWALLSLTVGLLFLRVLNSAHLYRRQAAATLVAALVPWAVNVVHVTGLVRFPANPMPFLFTLAGGAFAWAIFRFRFLDIVPVAREALVEEMRDAVVVLGEDGRVLDLNAAARSLLGVAAPREVLGVPAERALPALASVLPRPGDDRPAQREVRLGEGADAYDVRITPLRRSGALTGYLLVLHDVAERRRSEEALALQMGYLEHLFQASHEAIALLDNGDRVLEVNAEFTQLFGWTPREAMGRTLGELIVPEELRDQGVALIRLLTEGKRFELETVRRHRDGTRVEVSVSGIPVRVEGKQVAVYAIYQDITERKRMDEERAEMLLREQTARAEAEVEGRRAAFLADASSLLNTSLDYREVYGRLARMAVPFLADYCLVDQVEEHGGLRRIAVAHADPEKERLLVPGLRIPPDADAEWHPALRVVRTGEPLLHEEMPDDWREEVGRDPALQARLQALGVRSFLIVPLVARGNTLGAITLVFAHSGRRYGPEELRVAEELARRAALVIDNARLYGLAQQAVHARDDVLGVVSHDLRNPLTAILLNVTSLLEMPQAEDLPGWVREHMGWIVRSAEQMERLIQDLLDVARIEAGQLSVAPVPHDAGALVRCSVEMLAPLADERGIALCWEAPADTMRVRADPDRVQQVVSNLVGNALKFTPRGGTVTLGASPEGEWTRFWVRDTGHGIPPEHLPRIFDRFWQAQNARRSGAGLGLAIARGIVEAHGGSIWVESAPGEGTTVHFTLAATPEG